MRKCLQLLALVLVITATSAAEKPAFDNISQTMQAAINKNQIPGGVVLITRNDKIIYHKAFGNIMIMPERIKAQKNSIYDLASLTKLFTATLIMRLHDQGIIDITKPVATYLKSFSSPDKADITIEQLLTHRSGLPPGIPVENFTDGLKIAVEKIATIPLVSSPGAQFSYSDLGPIVAGYLAQQVTGKSLASLFKKHIFIPLGMRQTEVCPSKMLFKKIAANDTENGVLVHGRVHDPRANALGGCAGHAGIFSTATDVARFGQLFLNNGTYNGKQLLSSVSIKAMTTPNKSLPADEQRGVGFDINTKYSLPRGTLFGKNSFGHTGFTGTSLWIDPASKTVVVLLTNRLHPDGKGDVKELRGAIGTLAAQLVRGL